MTHADLIERLEEMAEYKYQSHTIHAPAVMREAAAALRASAAREQALRDLIQRWSHFDDAGIDAELRAAGCLAEKL